MTSRNQARHKRQQILLWIMVVTVLIGWRYPILGFSVPLVMIAGMAGSFINGRWICGNICPRGSFFDRVMARFSMNRGIPVILRNRAFRWALFIVLVALMFFQGFQNPASWEHWGMVFWKMCAVTTLIGVVLGFIYHPRSWCAFCPMGTMQSGIGGHKNRLRINRNTCVNCGLCEKVCPMGLAIYSASGNEVVDPDCIKCSECVNRCPKKSLFWPSADSDSMAGQQSARKEGGGNS